MECRRILESISNADRGYKNELGNTLLSQQTLSILQYPISTGQNGQKWHKLCSTAATLQGL
jgi:hypothetical protein